MRKTILMLSAIGSLAFASTASAQGLTVADPTPTGSFSGSYQCGYEWTYNAETETWEQDTSKPAYCDQTGYVYAGTDGVVACNGNEEITRPDDGTPLQGYIWIGPDQAASNPTAEAPGGIIGAGNNSETADGEPTGEAACTGESTSPPEQPTEPPAEG